MKRKSLIRLGLVVIGLGSASVFAQMQAPQPLPLDPSVRAGKLDNGLTYYIRHNEQPKDRAEFYIAQKVGSILEEENQRGLAHFLEHMAFNGTKNFPGKNMINYLEVNGIKFGANLNAYTGFDQTVYMIGDVPTINQNLVDSCMLILHDWSGYISLLDKEIDSERAVIHEEWRTRANPTMRMYEDVILPALYPNSRYANRMPIGLMEVVDNFEYGALRDYYHKWYRPDLQGVIIVGDIDVDYVERRIKEMWSDIPAAVNPAERAAFEVEDNKETIVSVASDKEASANYLSVMFKQDPMPVEYKQSVVGLQQMYLNNAIATMLNNRYEELTQKSDAPFMGAGASYGNFMISPTKKAFSISMRYDDNQWEKGLQAMVAVLNSAKEYGFTPSEYERVKADLLSMYENAYNERDSRKNKELVEEILSYFTDNEPAPGIETEYQVVNQLAQMTPLEAVNQVMQSYVTPENIVVTLMGVEKEGVVNPSKEQLLASFNAAMEIPAVAYEETVSNEPLVAKLPKPGKIKSVKQGDFGTTVWTLSNGAKVIIKPTDFKKDQIIMDAFSKGGQSLINGDSQNKRVMSEVINLGGLGAFSNTDLQKALAGKRASANAYVNEITEGIVGECAPKDFETMMQFTYLYFTAPRKDQEAFDSWMKRITANVSSRLSTPGFILGDSINATLYGHNPEMRPFRPEDLTHINYEQIMKLYGERFNNAGDFTFTFVGNVDPEAIKPLVEQYIATLPSKKARENFRDNSPRFVEGQVQNRFSMPMSTPKVTVYNVYPVKKEYSLENAMIASFFDQLMDMVYVETIREDEGGTYGVSSNAGVNVTPAGEAYFMYSFDTGEEKRDRLEARCFEEIKLIAEKGADAEKLGNIREYVLKQFNQSIKENNYWKGIISKKEIHGLDNYSNYEAVVNSITPEMVQSFANDIVNSGNRIQVVCTGVAQ